MTLAVEVARFDKWSLQVMPWPEYENATGKTWWRVYLFADVRPGRFYLKWDGERFAKGGEFHRANRSAPDALDTAKKLLADALPMQKLQPAPTCTN